MVENKFQKIKKDIEAVIRNSPEDEDVTHARIVHRLLLKLKPQTDYALQIAALAHDIDRGLPNRKTRADYPGDYDAYKKAHSINGARATVKILKQHKVAPNIIQKVERLVENHEFGGDKESDILMDADSLAFFNFDLENRYLRYHTQRQTLDKIIWMYGRLSSPKSKRLVQKMKYKNKKIKLIFNKAMKKLERAQNKEHETIKQTLIKAVSQAGDELLKRFHNSKHGTRIKKSKHETVTPADRAANRIILKEIKKTFPNHGIISEESKDENLNAEFVWCIDPLDGTTNFSIGNPLFAVSVAVFENKKLLMSAIYAPYLKEFYFAHKGKGAYFIKGYKGQEGLKGLERAKKLKVSKESRLLHSICTYCFGYEERVYARMERIEAKLRKDFQEARLLGTAAVELAWVAAGRTESMLVPAVHIWDVAAGILLVREAGGKVTDLKGREWVMTSKAMVATNGVIHGKVLRMVNRK